MEDDHQLLDQTIKQAHNFPWQEVADQLHMNRWRLYHWYFETFQRSLHDQMTLEDVEKMKQLLREANQADIIPDKQFQQYVKEQLSREYHRSTFSIAFNNAKRQLYRETNRTHSPTKPFSYFVPMQAPQASAPGNAQKGRKGETLSDQIQRELQ